MTRRGIATALVFSITAVMGLHQATAPRTAAAQSAEKKGEPRGAGPSRSVDPGRKGEHGKGAMSCEPGARVEATMYRAVRFADTDRDGKLSRAEADGMVDFLVGGFFFRADANNDGRVTPEEGRELRSELRERHPELAMIAEQTRQSGGETPFAALAQYADVEYGETLTAADARKAARSAVEDLYAKGDTDKDGALSPDEARQLGTQGAQALGDSAFRAADQNSDQSLTLEEFQLAIQKPAEKTFELADTDDDGKLSREEAATAVTQLSQIIQISPAQK